MRRVIMVALAAFCAVGCEGPPETKEDAGPAAPSGSGSCEVEPQAVPASSTYAVTVHGAAANETLSLHVTNSAGTETKLLLADASGDAHLDLFASTAGSSIIEIGRETPAGEVVIATCVAHVADASGCGDAVCAADESCGECADDCGVCPESCGDGVCGATEACGDCPDDCGACEQICGDGTCNLVESCQNCPEDCDACAGAVCGDGSCDAGENCTTCEGDCGACPASCGDGTCDAGESCSGCSRDCGICPPECGDLLCNGAESCDSCAADCGACGQECQPASSSMPNGRHRAGRACTDSGCHNGEFSIAGTVYNSASGSSAVGGATIVITDANGNIHMLVSASNGNFYTSGNIPLPATVVGTKCPTVHQMNDPVSNGNCNHCHTSGNRIYVE